MDKPETRDCARCLAKISSRAVVGWLECDGVDPKPVAYCSDACRETDRDEQDRYEAHMFETDPGWTDR